MPGAGRINCRAGSASASRLARALAKMPKLLLLDEPLAALDRKLREETRRELIAIQERVGTTFLVVTHDQEEALGMASRIAVMNAGRLVQIGAPAEIYERPNSRFVAGFVGEVNLFEGEVVAAGGCPALRAPMRIDQPVPLPGGARSARGRRWSLALRPEKLSLSHDAAGWVRADGDGRSRSITRARVAAAAYDAVGAGVEGAAAERRGGRLFARRGGVGELGRRDAVVIER